MSMPRKGYRGFESLRLRHSRFLLTTSCGVTVFVCVRRAGVSHSSQRGRVPERHGRIEARGEDGPSVTVVPRHETRLRAPEAERCRSGRCGCAPRVACALLRRGRPTTLSQRSEATASVLRWSGTMVGWRKGRRHSARLHRGPLPANRVRGRSIVCLTSQGGPSHPRPSQERECRRADPLPTGRHRPTGGRDRGAATLRRIRICAGSRTRPGPGLGCVVGQQRTLPCRHFRTSRTSSSD